MTWTWLTLPGFRSRSLPARRSAQKTMATGQTARRTASHSVADPRQSCQTPIEHPTAEVIHVQRFE